MLLTAFPSLSARRLLAAAAATPVVPFGGLDIDGWLMQDAGLLLLETEGVLVTEGMFRMQPRCELIFNF